MKKNASNQFTKMGNEGIINGKVNYKNKDVII